MKKKAPFCLKKGDEVHYPIILGDYFISLDIRIPSFTNHRFESPTPPGGPNEELTITLPETNSQFAPKNGGFQVRNFPENGGPLEKEIPWKPPFLGANWLLVSGRVTIS